MALVNLVGVQPLDFETKEGDKIEGINLHITYQDENVYGDMCDKKFISSAACKKLMITEDKLIQLIGQVIDIQTNIKGKLTGVKPA